MSMEIIKLDGSASINMLVAMNFLNKAWEEVTANIIQHFFCHTGFWSSFANAEEEIEQFKKEDDISFTDWVDYSVQYTIYFHS